MYQGPVHSKQLVTMNSLNDISEIAREEDSEENIGFSPLLGREEET